MACFRGDVGCCRGVLGLARTALCRSELALACNNCCFAGPNGGVLSPRPLQRDPDSDIQRQWRDHHRHDCFLIFSDSRIATTSRSTEGPAAFSGRTMDHQHFGVCAVVLEARCRRPAATRSYAWAFRKLVSFPADVDPGRPEFVLVASLHGLPLSCL